MSTRGFAAVDAGDGRTGGLAASAADAECVLRLSSRGLRAGYVAIGYEKGWRNAAVARVSCEPPCE